MWLNDYLVWGTKKGKELGRHDLSKDENGELVPSSANGHGAIYYYYTLSDEAKSKCKKIHAMDLSSPKNFPAGIAKDIKDMKMIRMSKGQTDWELLLPLLSEKYISLVLGERATYDYKVNLYDTSVNTYKQTFHTDMLENVKFSTTTSPDKQKEILEKLKRIFSTGEARAKEYRFNLVTILAFFDWYETKEGKSYWYDIYTSGLILPFETKQFKMPDNSPEFYWHDLVWKYFKTRRYRNPLWR
jgi:hypothetical protein